MELFEESAQKTPPDLNLPRGEQLFEFSVNAWYAAIHASMSELPIQKEISRFVEKTAKAGSRAAAERIAFDRGDPDVLVVLQAARKVLAEIHRMTGFLRFNPESSGVYTARCSPDYNILPALADHFTLRFGETPWSIIDEKRNLCLCRENGGKTRLIPLPPAGLGQIHTERNTADPWEDLWRLYHRSINNESRKNTALQQQCMPKRYHKYLPEMNH